MFCSNFSIYFLSKVYLVPYNDCTIHIHCTHTYTHQILFTRFPLNVFVRISGLFHSFASFQNARDMYTKHIHWSERRKRQKVFWRGERKRKKMMRNVYARVCAGWNARSNRANHRAYTYTPLYEANKFIRFSFSPLFSASVSSVDTHIHTHVHSTYGKHSPSEFVMFAIWMMRARVLMYTYINSIYIRYNTCI